MQIRIKRAIEKVPGGMMIVPLAIGAAINTFAPHAGAFFGSFTGALFTGALPILAVFYVCIGAKITLRSLPRVLRKGGALLATKFALGVAAGYLLGHLIGVEPVHSGWFAGVSTLAVVAAVNDTNGGLYMSLMEQYGTPEDSAAYSVMALESGPFLTMVSLGVAGLSAFPWQTLAGAILPIAIGMLLGNLDSELRAFLANGVSVLIPFFAFALGATLNLRRVWEAGLLGLALGAGIVLVCAVCLILVDRLIGGNGTAGIAASTTAGNAAAVPLLVAAANPHYANAAAPATVLVGTSVIVSSMLVPPLTALWKGRIRWSDQRTANSFRDHLARTNEGPMPPFYSQPTDVATLSPHAIAADLRATLARAERQLAAIPPAAAAQPLAPGKWSTQQTVGHLIDSCTNNLQRLIRLQLTSELTFPGYQQDECVRLQRFDLEPWPKVLALLLALNYHFAHAIEHADTACFTHVWLHEGERLTLGFILVDYIGHLDHHLRQLPGYIGAVE